MRGLTVVDGVLVAAVVALAAVVVVPQRRVKRILDNEDRIVADLRDLERRLQEHRKAALRDRDGDGVGEYAPLTEVLAGSGRSEAARREGTSDVWILDGYRFATMVPGRDGHPVLAGGPDDAPDKAEVAYLLVAWPEEPGRTGMRAYLTSLHGVLVHQIDGYPYGALPPAPAWQLVESGDDGRLRRGGAYAARDWSAPVRTLR